MRDIMLILHLVGLAMGLGSGFAFMFLGIASSKMEVSEGRKFMMNAFAIGKMGIIGLTLLVISGVYLLMPYMSSITSMPTLIAKLLFVLLLITLVVVNLMLRKKFMQTKDENILKSMAMIGRVNLMISILIVVLAVYTFH